MAPLTQADSIRFIENTAVHESGGNFGACNRDGEFEGRFNRPGKEHPAFGRYHIGLSYGIVQFTQDSGALGTLLRRMESRDADHFRATFGDAWQELLDVTTAGGPRSKHQRPRGPRVQPVDGEDLWEDSWVDRFREAGDHRPFQEAQLELAAELYLDPMLPFCNWLGLTTDRALATVFDRAIQLGRGGARRWIMDVVGPIEDGDDDSLEFALDSYGFENLRELQAAVPGMEVDGAWGPNTHAGVCWIERQRSDDDPFVLMVPDTDMMLDMMVAASDGKHWGHRVKKLRESTAFNDVAFDL